MAVVVVIAAVVVVFVAAVVLIVSVVVVLVFAPVAIVVTFVDVVSYSVVTLVFDVVVFVLVVIRVIYNLIGYGLSLPKPIFGEYLLLQSVPYELDKLKFTSSQQYHKTVKMRHLVTGNN